MGWVFSIWAAVALPALCGGMLPPNEAEPLSPSGYHLCLRNETKAMIFPAMVKKPLTVSKPCGWLFWKTCPVTVYQITYRLEHRTVAVRVNGCCDGYEQVGRYCALPVNRSAEFAAKPGCCPDADGVCPGRRGCERDVECPGWKKCCQGCGGRVCTDPARSANCSMNGGHRFNVTVTVKTDYQQLTSKGGGLLNHTRLLQAMLSGALPGPSVYYLASWPVHPYRTATSLLLQCDFTPSLHNVTSELHPILKHIQEVLSLTVEDVNECTHPSLHRCSSLAHCNNTVGSYQCRCREGYVDVDPGNPGAHCEAASTSNTTDAAVTSAPSPPYTTAQASTGSSATAVVNCTQNSVNAASFPYNASRALPASYTRPSSTAGAPTSTTSRSPPGISRLQLGNVTGISFCLYWSSESQANQTYRVVLHMGSEVLENWETNNTMLEVMNLQPGVVYNITVTPYDDISQGDTLHTIVKTDSLTLDATTRLTNIQFTADLENSSSPAYKNLTMSIMEEICLLSPEIKAKVASGQVRIVITGFSPGSVVVNIRIVAQPSQSQDIRNTSAALLNSLKNSSKFTMDENSTNINDVDECASGENDCSQLATCNNTWSSYTCACLDGFVDLNPQRPGRSCQAIIAVSTTAGTTTAMTPAAPTSASTAATNNPDTPTSLSNTPTTASIAPTTSYTAPMTTSTAPTSSFMPPSTTSIAPTTTSTVPATTSIAPTLNLIVQVAPSTAPTTASTAPATTSTAHTTASTAPSTTFTAPTTISNAPATASTAPTTTSNALTATSIAPTTTSNPPTTTSITPTTTSTASTTTSPPTTATLPEPTTTSTTLTATSVPASTPSALGIRNSPPSTAPTSASNARTATAFTASTLRSVAQTTTSVVPTATSAPTIATIAPISAPAAPTTSSNIPPTTSTALSTTSTVPTTNSAATTHFIVPATTTTVTPSTTSLNLMATTPPMMAMTAIPTITPPASTASSYRTTTVSMLGLISVQCAVAAITVTISKEFLSNNNIMESSLYLGQQECGANGRNATHVQLTVGWDECSTIVVRNHTDYVASVTLFNNLEPFFPLNGTLVVPKIRLVAPIVCTYTRSMVMSADFSSMGHDMIKDVILGSGSFQVTVQLLNGTAPLPHNYSLSPEEAVVVQVSMNTSSEQIKIVISSCWATPTPNPLDINRFIFLDNRCALNSYTKVLMNGNTSTSRVSVQIFSFVNVNMIYLHCQVQICVQMDSETCVPDCVQRTSRFSNDIGTALGSSGPLLKFEEDVLEDENSSIYLIGMSCMGLGLSLIFIVGLVCLFYYQRNRIGHYNFNVKPKEENFTYLVFNT